MSVQTEQPERPEQLEQTERPEQAEGLEQATRMDQEVFSFEADVAQILDLVVHSLYSNKEIFLRELISNASDAIDRLRLELLTQGEELPEDEGSLEIRVSYDKDAGTITIRR